MTWAYYKPGQGTIARGATAVTLAAFALFGCVTLNHFVSGFFSGPETMVLRGDMDAAQLVGRSVGEDISDPDATDAPKILHRGDRIQPEDADTLLLLASASKIREVQLERVNWWDAAPGDSEVLLTVGATWGSLVCGLVFLGMCSAIYQFVLIRPGPAEFLIETEIEFRRVSWPQKHEYLGSSFVVILSVVFLGAFLFVGDQVLIQLLRLLPDRN